MRVALTFLALCFAAVAAPAQAQELTEAQRAEAQAHFEQGSGAYDRGDYAEAEAEFRAAYELTRHPDLLYNIYTAAERNGRLPEAVEALEGYLADGEIEAARRESLGVRRERLRLRIEQSAIAEREEAAQVEAERRASVEQAQARALQDAEDRNVEASRAAARRAATEASSGTADALLISGIVSLVAGGLALVSYGVFGGLSLAEADTLRAQCDPFGCLPEETSTLASLNLAADISWISGAGLVALGVGLLLASEGTRGSAGDQAWLAPSLGPSYVGAAAGGGF